MGFIKMLIGLPLLVVILVFAFVNNDLAVFNLWPFYIEITVSLSVAIVFFIFFGFVLGELFSWMSYAPVRKALRSQRKQNRKLSKEQQKLVKEMENLHENLESYKEQEVKTSKPGLGARLKGIFSRKRKVPLPLRSNRKNKINFDKV